MELPKLFLERHTAEQILGSLVDRPLRVKIDGQITGVCPHRAATRDKNNGCATSAALRLLERHFLSEVGVYETECRLFNPWVLAAS
jgi:hypothetical protein